MEKEIAAHETNLRIAHDDHGAALSDGSMELRADFSRMLPRIKPGVLHGELIVKAARCKGIAEPIAIDATAGLGEDSLLLAAAGFTVYLFERNPRIAELLRSALRDAASTEALSSIAGRMHVFEADSVPVLQALAQTQGQGQARATRDAAESDCGAPAANPPLPAGIQSLVAHLAENRPAAVLLDPMFPARTKSAAVKKKFQLLHQLEVPCTPAEEEALLQAALAARPAKVIVKRPAKGPFLCDRKPSYSLKGKAVRYDVYA